MDYNMILIAVVALVVGFVLGTAYANLIMQEIKCEAGEVFASPDSIKSNPAPSGEELDEKDFVSEWEVVDDFGLPIRIRYYRTEVEGEFVHKFARGFQGAGKTEFIARNPINNDVINLISEGCIECRFSDANFDEPASAEGNNNSTDYVGEIIHNKGVNCKFYLGQFDFSSNDFPEGSILVDGDDEQVTREPISEDTAEWVEEHCAEVRAFCRPHPKSIQELAHPKRQDDIDLQKDWENIRDRAAIRRCAALWKDSKTVWEKIEEKKDNENQ